MDTSRGYAARTIWLALEASATVFSGKQDFGMCELQKCKKVPARHAKRVSPRPPHGRQPAQFPAVFRFVHFLCSVRKASPLRQIPASKGLLQN